MAGAFTTHAFDHGQWSLSQIEDICQNEKSSERFKILNLDKSNQLPLLTGEWDTFLIF